MQRLCSDVEEEWRRKGCGLLIGRERLMYICWADDNWLFAKLATELSYVVQTLEETAQRMACLELRLPKCHWTGVQR